MGTITSHHNQRVKDAAKLRSRRHRDRQQRILIDGVREIQRAMEAGVAILEVFVSPAHEKHPASQRLLEAIEDYDVPTFQVSTAVFERLAYGDRNEGVIVVASLPVITIDHLAPPEGGVTGVLVGVEKPGNVGAVVRSADASGIRALIVADGATDLYNPNAIRASLGTIFTMPVCCASSAETIAWLQRHRVAMFAARVDATQLYTDVDFSGTVAIALGGEARGLPTDWDIEGVTPIGLPMLGSADSLNVSTTAAVLFYEALRQRQPHTGA